MKKNIFLSIALLATNFVANATTSSNFVNTQFVQRPHLSQPRLINFDTNFTYSSADKAFDKNSNKVSFLEQYGTENMLKRFTDATLSRDDTSSFGEGLLSGKVSTKQLETSWSYNFNRHWGIKYSMAIQDSNISKITAAFNQDEATLSTDQKRYLEDLHKKLPQTFNQFGFAEAQILGRFNHTFDNFAHIDFVDITVESGIILPSQFETTKHNLFVSPLSPNVSFRYPLYLSASAGILDWLNFGYFTNFIVAQTAYDNFPVQHTNTNNHLLISDTAYTRYKPGTVFETGFHVEADHLVDIISIVFGYNYTQQGQSKITPSNKNLFPYLEANKPATTSKWSKGTIYVQFEIDLATKEKPNAPLIKLSYSKVLKGTFAAQTRSLSGSFGLQFCYNF